MAWKSFMTGWTEQKFKDENGVESNKPEEEWSETELKQAKFNSRALSAIHASVTKKHFEFIQGCVRLPRRHERFCKLTLKNHEGEKLTDGLSGLQV